MKVKQEDEETYGCLFSLCSAGSPTLVISGSEPYSHSDETQIISLGAVSSFASFLSLGRQYQLLILLVGSSRGLERNEWRGVLPKQNDVDTKSSDKGRGGDMKEGKPWTCATETSYSHVVFSRQPTVPHGSLEISRRQAD